MGKRQNSANIGGLAQNAKANISGSSAGVIGSPLRPYELWHSGGDAVEVKNRSVTLTGTTSGYGDAIYVPTTDCIYAGSQTGTALKIDKINPYTMGIDSTYSFAGIYAQEVAFSFKYCPVRDLIYFFRIDSTTVTKVNPHTMAMTSATATSTKSVNPDSVYCPLNGCFYYFVDNSLNSFDLIFFVMGFLTSEK